jgi:hypothetical protein
MFRTDTEKIDTHIYIEIFNGRDLEGVGTFLPEGVCRWRSPSFASMCGASSAAAVDCTRVAPSRERMTRRENRAGRRPDGAIMVAGRKEREGEGEDKGVNGFLNEGRVFM